MNKKYELTDECIDFNGHKLYRIKALKMVALDVLEGDLGGYVETYKNLSQEGMCWIYDDAKVYDRAIVTDDARVLERAIVCDDAKVSERATVMGKAFVLEKAKVYGRALLSDWALIRGNAKVYDSALVTHNARVYGNAKVFGGAFLSENACVYGNAKVSGESGDPVIGDHTKIFENAVIKSPGDYVYVNGLCHSYTGATFFRQADRSIYVSCGCFRGSINEFADYIVENHRDSMYAKEYLMLVNLIRMHFSKEFD